MATEKAEHQRPESDRPPGHAGSTTLPGEPLAAEQPARLYPVVFGVAAVVALAFIGWGVFGTENLSTVSGAILTWIIANAGWAFVLAASGFVVFALWLALSRYGEIPLGQDGEEPEFRTVSWVAMMFSAGMGIGLMFYGVSEPLSHFTNPPPGTVPGMTDEALETAMATTLFHWTLHPWAIYAVVGLAIAYGSFRRGRRQLISAVFEPLIGKKQANGPIGKAIDVMAIFATLFGSAASLGLGALQIGRGMKEVGWMESASTTVLVLIIVVLTVAFIASGVSGVAKGIQWLSNINMVLAGLLALFLFVVGPTVLILNLLPTSIGHYFADAAEMAARTAASGGDAMASWLGDWTIFYWAWWISWTPFVGMFVARISRGRTIRQFVSGVILVPSLVSLVWFAILGGTALNFQRNGVDLAGTEGQEAKLFGVLQQFPGWAGIASVVVMILVAIFFVSGADAASIVMGTLSQRGSIEPKKSIVIFWGALTGAVAAVMLMVGGATALDGLQKLTIIAAVPFAVVMVMMCISLAKDLRSDPLVPRENKAAEVIKAAVIQGTEQYGDEFALEVCEGNGNGNGADGPVLKVKAAPVDEAQR